MDSRLTRNVLVGFAAMIVAAGCAGNSQRADSGTPDNDAIERAAASIDEAERAGAFEHGSADLNRAREKLTAARKASEEGDDDVAQRLAIEADLDADVAAATARNQEMQSAVTELEDSIRTLQDELRRNEQRSLGRL
jgi:predicted metal-dependent hydrolase